MKQIEQEVIQKYKVHGSIRATWKSLAGTASEQLVRKVLITHGLYSTKISDEVYELYERGYTQQEIAKELNISDTWVNANLPYTKGVYKFEPSAKAQTVRRCRERKLNKK